MRPSNTDELADFLASHAPVPVTGSVPAGTVFEGWRTTAFLGRGGSGEVYRVVQGGTEQVAALKILLPKTDAERQGTARERFLREATFLAHNVAPFFPKLLASGEAEGRPFLVMELLDTRTLPQRDRDVAAFLQKICTAVRFLHRRGFVHRDIKPQNILWRADGEPVLVDLGLLKGTADAPGHTGMSVTLMDGKAVGAGTPHYAAPEQFGGGAVSAAMDIHALGVLIDTCFQGRPPHAWNRIVRRATSSLPEYRYRDVDDLMRAIRRRHVGRIFLWVGIVIAAALVPWFCHPQDPREVDRAFESVRWCALGETFVTNATPVTVVRLNRRTYTFDHPVVLPADREWWIRGPGTLDATLLGEKPGTRVFLDGCTLLNRTTCPPKETGLHYVFRARSYLNFIDQNPSNDVARTTLYKALEGFEEGREATRSEIWFGGPETFEKILLMRRQRWERDQEERVRYLRQIGGR